MLNVKNKADASVRLFMLSTAFAMLEGSYSAAFAIRDGKGNHKFPVGKGNQKVGEHQRCGGVIHSKSDLEVFLYRNQPCITGAYRKYEDTHKGLATSNCPNPNDVYPPFPSGLVEAFLIKMPMQKSSLPWLEAALGENSPWRSGIGEHEIIKGNDGTVKALFFTGTDVNPTVLGNFLRFCCRANGPHAEAFNSYLKAGLTESEALVLSVAFWGDVMKDVHGSSYIMKPDMDVRNIRDGVCRDLSKGKTLREGGDYNRTDNETIFRSNNKARNVNLLQLMEKVKKDNPKATLRQLYDVWFDLAGGNVKMKKAA